MNLKTLKAELLMVALPDKVIPEKFTIAMFTKIKFLTIGEQY